MTTLPFKDLIARSRRPSSLARAAGHSLGDQEEDTPFFSLTDAVMGIPRGLEGAARGVYGLADTLTGDSLPDLPDERFLGRSRSMVGGFVESAAQFASAFIPVLGPGALAARGASAVLGVGTLTGRAAIAGRAAVAMTAGAAADFAVFDGHEARLANFIQEFPGLENPITEFLAADPDDDQIVGRLKNALEGGGVGLLADGLVHGLKSLNKIRRARASGKTAAEVAEVAAEVDAAAIRESMRSAATDGSSIAEAAKAGQLDDATRALDPHRAATKAERIKRPTTAAEVLSDMGLDADKVGRVIDRTSKALDEADLPVTETSAPRDQPVEERLVREIAAEDINLSEFATPSGPQRLLAAMRTLVGDVAREELDSLAPTQMAVRAELLGNKVNDMLGAPDALERLGQWMRGGLKNARETTEFGMEIRIMTASMGSWVSKKIKAARDVNLRTDLSRAEAIEAITLLADTMATLQGVAAEAGRNLGQYRLPISARADTIRALDRLTKAGDIDGTKKLPKVDPTELDLNVKTVLDQAGGQKAIDKYLAQLDEMIGDGTDFKGIAGFNDMIGPNRGRNATNMAVELWINALLSGARTWTINWVTPMLASVYVPLERIVGGAMMRDNVAVKSGMAQISGLLRDTDEALRFAMRTIKNRRATLLPRTGFNDPFGRGDLAESVNRNAQMKGQPTKGSFAPEVRGIEADSTAGIIGRYLDKVVGFPSAAIAGTDEFVKQLNFRSVARDELTRDALGKGLDATDVTRHVEEQMAIMIRDGEAFSRDRLFREGMNIGKSQGLEGADLVEAAEAHANANMDAFGSSMLPVVRKAKARANEVTFQDSLEKGTFGRWLQDGVVQHPMLRLFVLPFVKTPTNILKFAGRRVDATGPIRLLMNKKFGREAPKLSEIRNKFLRDYLEGERAAKGGLGDPLKKADAVGRLTTGLGLMGVFSAMTLSGKITGRGPSDPERRKLMEQAGWRPYSMRIGDHWVDYRRMDPWATMLGFVADLSEYSTWADTTQQGEVESALMAGLVSLSNVLTQASYLTGIRNFTEALSNPQTSVATFTSRMAGSLLVPNVVSQFTVPAGDENFREARGILDTLVRRVPGLSEDLEPRRNMLGEPIRTTRRLGQDELGSAMNVWMPIAYSEVSDNVVDQELADLKHGFSAPKPTKGGLDLLEFRSPSGQTAFDRWSELHGKVDINGRTLQQELRKLVTNSQYKALPAESLPNMISPRVRAVNKVIQRYRDKAWDQTVREYPALAQRWAQLGGDRVQAFEREAARHRAAGPGSILTGVLGGGGDRLRGQISRRN